MQLSGDKSRQGIVVMNFVRRPDVSSRDIYPLTLNSIYCQESRISERLSVGTPDVFSRSEQQLGFWKNPNAGTAGHVLPGPEVSGVYI